MIERTNRSYEKSMENYTLVTGSAGGIGRAIAEEFARHSHSIVLVDINEARVQEASKEIKETYGVKTYGIAADLCKDETPDKIYKELADHSIFIDVLVNNAGVGGSGDYAESNWDKQKMIVELNNVALMHMCRVFLPSMLEKRNCHIINIASNAAFMPLAPQPVYAASKAFVLSFSQALYEEYKDRGVKVSCICPGPTKTAFFEANGFGLKNLKGKTPGSVGRFAYSKGMDGVAVASHGFATKMESVLSRLFPRGIVRRVAAKVGESSQ